MIVFLWLLATLSALAASLTSTRVANKNGLSTTGAWVQFKKLTNKY